MITATFFDKVNELEEITGLTEKELWEKGFNLDDLDCGFCIAEEEPFTLEEYEELGYTRFRWKNDIEELYYNSKEVPFSMHKLLWDWENHCVGYDLARYDGKVFVLLHHA